MYFKNRNQAAELLAAQLLRYKKKHPLILGIPRGSVPMAKILATRLEGDLDVVLVRKIGAPDNPEFAIGSISEFGAVFRGEGLKYYDISARRFEELAQQQLLLLKKRREIYSPIRPPLNPLNRIVIIIDDGIATGSTMVAAVRAVRSQRPKKIIVAAPIAPPSVLKLLQKEADELLILDTPSDFFSISQFYEDFPQVSDQEVYQTLSNVHEGIGFHAPPPPSL